MENFAVNAIYERNESGERSAEDEKWWFNSNRTNEDFPLKRKEQEVVTRTHISRVESQIRMEKISPSSSMCDYDEECERMDCNDEEEEDDDEDDDSLLAVEDLKSSLTTLQEQKNTKATTTKRKNDNNNNDNDAKAGESFRGCTISQLLSFHDTDERKIPLHDIELHEDMLRDQLTKDKR